MVELLKILSSSKKTKKCINELVSKQLNNIPYVNYVIIITKDAKSKDIFDIYMKGIDNYKETYERTKKELLKNIAREGKKEITKHYKITKILARPLTNRASISSTRPPISSTRHSRPLSSRHSTSSHSPTPSTSRHSPTPSIKAELDILEREEEEEEEERKNRLLERFKMARNRYNTNPNHKKDL